MKTTLLIFITTLVTYYANAQCSFDEIFPFKYGMSKFEVINLASTLKTMKENSSDYHMNVWNYWFKYNSKDSAYQATIFYKYLDHHCFLGKNNTLKLEFIDDKLYNSLIIIEFKENEFNRCLDNYNSLIKTLKTEFEFTEPFYLKNNNNEKTGEGLYLCNTPITFDNAFDKNVMISITYNINFDYSTNTPNGYSIRLKYKNSINTIFEK